MTHRRLGWWASTIFAATALAAPATVAADHMGGISGVPVFAIRQSVVPEVPEIVMADSFTTAGAVDGRLPESRGTAAWTELRGSWRTADGSLVVPSIGAPGRPNLVVVPTGRADVAVEVDVTVVAGDSAGIVVRSNAVATPAASLRQLEIDLAPAPGGGGTLSVRARRGATATPLATFGVAESAPHARLAVSAAGATITVALDSLVVGVVVLSAADLAEFDGDHHGLLAPASSTTRFDDVLVTAA